MELESSGSRSLSQLLGPWPLWIGLFIKRAGIWIIVGAGGLLPVGNRRNLL